MIFGLKRTFIPTAKLLVLISLLCLFTILEGQFAGGNGTQQNPFQVETAEHLNNVRNYTGEEHSDVHFIQIADINLGEPPWNEDLGWVFIGHMWGKFSATYNGNNYVVENLFINRPVHNDIGLFGATEGATIKNLGIVNADVTGYNRVGILVGECYDNTTIMNCYTSGNVNGYNSVGGMLGRTRRVAVINCGNTANIHGFEDHIGGLIGHNSGGTILYCYSSSNVLGRQYVSGLIGYTSGIIQNSYSRSNVVGVNMVGGLIGLVSGATVNYCYSSSRVTADEISGGLIAVRGLWPSVINNSYWDIEASRQAVSAGGEGRLTRQMVYPYDINSTYRNWRFGDVWVDDVTHINNEGYPFLYWQPFESLTTPSIAERPYPANLATDIKVTLTRVRWSYKENSLFSNPIGFRVYMNTNGEFDEDDDFIWVDYNERQENYATNIMVPDNLLYYNTYYWKVVPTTVYPYDRNTACVAGNQRGDAQNIPVWRFRTEQNPIPIAAVNPQPADNALDIPLNLQDVSWSYTRDPAHVKPVGFRVYFNNTGEFHIDDDYCWVWYSQYITNYSTSGLLTDELEHYTTYYWKVVPTTKEPGFNSSLRLGVEDRFRVDAQNVLIWSFVTMEEITGIDEYSLEVHQVKLYGNHPNPFNPQTTIRFSLAEASYVVLEVFNNRGQSVVTLFDGFLNTGIHSLVWDGRDSSNDIVGSGVYFYKIKTTGMNQDNQVYSIRKMIMLR